MLGVVPQRVVVLSGLGLRSSTALPTGADLMASPLSTRQAVPEPRPRAEPDPGQTSGNQDDIAGPVTALPGLRGGLDGWTVFAVVWMTGMVVLRVRSWLARHGTGR